MKTRQRDGKGKVDARVGENRGPVSKKEPLSERIITGTMWETSDGHYKIGKELGRGCSSVVYKGKMVRFMKSGEPLAEKDVAVKVLRLDGFVFADEKNNEEIRNMLRKVFETQAMLSFEVSHPNVMRTLDFGFDDGNPFIVMEYFAGKDLHDILTENKTLPWEWLGPVMVEVCDGLDAIHERGIIHREVMLSNIMVGGAWPNREVKVLDFGLAIQAPPQDTGEELTRHSQIVGAPFYMAPEQAFGGTIDPRTDVYGVGSVMYHALTGTTVFHGDNVNELLEQLITNEKVEPLRERRPDLNIPEEAERIVLKCLKRNPADRYQSMKELRAAIADTM